VERVAVAAILRCDLGGFTALRVEVPSPDAVAMRLPCSARTPSTTIATTVNFDRNDIT
jgi:hypothetical protein